MTKNSPNNLTGSIISTKETFPHRKTVYRADKTNKTISTVKTHTIVKIDNIAKSFFTVPTIKELKSKKKH